jgi:hypothetical protein
MRLQRMGVDYELRHALLGDRMVLAMNDYLTLVVSATMWKLMSLPRLELRILALKALTLLR